jgi:isoquinoline 1-oxidoreductase beta subunit
VIHSGGAFVTESFLDELAHASRQDPLDLRLGLWGDAGEFPYADFGGPVVDIARLRNVTEMAAEAAGWGSRKEEGRFLGIAARFVFGSYAAQVAEVSVDGQGRVKVHKMVGVIDAGVPVNPRGLRAQVEGGIVFGLSSALKQSISLRRGSVLESNFHDYPILRLSEMPKIEVRIVDSPNPPKGAGETSVPPVAPAVANAIFAATGRRCRRPPFLPSTVRAASVQGSSERTDPI